MRRERRRHGAGLRFRRCLLHGIFIRAATNGRAQCQSRGGDLATIHSAAEDAAAKEVVPSGSSAWIGLSDTRPQKARRLGRRGSALDYVNHMGGEPNQWGGNEDCAGSTAPLQRRGRTVTRRVGECRSSGRRLQHPGFRRSQKD